MADILLTNDDGYKSVGFLSLLKELSRHFSVAAVAPTEERSWIGKSISARTPLRLKQERCEGFTVFTLTGTPADCVQVGLYDVLKEKPRLVISGINLGDNAGSAQTLSSGTVGAAMEASLDGVPSLSASLNIPPNIKATTDFFDTRNKGMFTNAAAITAKIAKIAIAKGLGTGVDMLSVNIPFEATIDTPVAVTVPFRGPYGKLFHKKRDAYVHVNPNITFKLMQAGKTTKGTDIHALATGKISIAPLSLELTSKDAIKRIEKLINDSW